MTVMERTGTVTIRLEAECLDAGCGQLAHRMHTQLGVQKYSRGASVMPVPESVEEWRAGHRTARKRADRAARLGYTFGPIDRTYYTDDIHRINTSLPERQGRPMSAGYLERNVYGKLPVYPCERHRIETFGIVHEGATLVAYLTLYAVGDLHLVSMILGHGDHLRNDVMYLLAAGMVEARAGQAGVFMYNRHDSGTAGLVYYKERVGFSAADIEWVL